MCPIVTSIRLLFAVSVVLACAACGGSAGQSSSGSDGGTFSDGGDPAIVDFPIAYVKRPLLVDDDGDLETSSIREATVFRPGAELLLRDRASPSATETSVTSGIFLYDDEGNPPLYDVKDLSASFDGERLLFAMRAPEDPDLDDDEQPTWNIWMYDHPSGTSSRIIGSDITAEGGHDVAPHFLPDGRIVFASTRQRQSKAVLLDEGKPQFSALDENRNEEALTLHVMNADGSDVHQITFNQSSDLDPTVLGDGRIAFSRWDNVAGNDQISFYSVNPDGTDLQLLYGVHSHDTGPNGETVDFVEAAELADGRLLAALRSPDDQARMGAIPAAIDVDAYVEHDQPTFDNLGLLADAQEILIPGALSLDEAAPVIAGRYASFAPLFDGTDRILLTWSQCRLTDVITDPANPLIAPCTDENLLDPNFIEADPLYGVWMFDRAQDTQLPVVVAAQGEVYSEVVVMEPKVLPPVILDQVAGIDLDADLVSESVGIIHIRSVYDFDGAAVADLAVLSNPGVTVAADRPARFVRVVKAVSMPDDDIVDLDGTDFGRSRAQLMREIIGYGHVEPDGSVRLKVPANIAFWLDVLDANGRRIFPRHNNWLQLRPGEELECNGCHTPQSEAPHGRMNAEAPAANPGATVDGSPFPNTEPALFADAGETMAQVITRINGVPEPDVDVAFDDVWTDPNVRAKDASFAYAYADLTTPAPLDPGCVTNWTALCRIVIHYETHIHPLWGVDRRQLDAMGNVLGDDTCTSCHSSVDAMGGAMVPASLLDLSDGASADELAHFRSYRELFFEDPNEGRDEPILNVAGANFSPAFFDRFAPGGTHAGRLTDAELKLISEYVDIGGQYYNDPFVAPQ